MSFIAPDFELEICLYPSEKRFGLRFAI